MIDLLLLPLRLALLLFELMLTLILLPFRILFAISITLLSIIGVLFVIGGIFLAFTVVGILPGALLGIFGLGLIALGSR